MEAILAGADFIIARSVDDFSGTAFRYSRNKCRRFRL